MLYVTTNDKTNVCTAVHTLVRLTDRDGGVFVPFRMIPFSRQMLDALSGASPGVCISQTLEYFFGARVSSPYFDQYINTDAFRCVQLGHRIQLITPWKDIRRPLNDAAYSVASYITGDGCVAHLSIEWMKTVLWIGVLVWVYSNPHSGSNGMDISVEEDDFALLLAAHYAAKLGIPMGRIVFVCKENSNYWSFLKHGQIETGKLSEHECAHIQRLLHETVGQDESLRFCNAVGNKETYTIGESMARTLLSTISPLVVSRKRRNEMICSLQNTYAVSVDENTAAAFCGIQNHRVNTNIVGDFLIFS